MTLDDVKIRVAKIHENQYDNEVAHPMIDNLHTLFIRHVAEVGEGELQVMAREICTIEKFKIEKWFS